MATAKTARTATTTATSSRAKALSSADTKRPTAVAALGTEATAYLNKLKAKVVRGTALTAAQQTDLRDLEAQRVARNAYTRWLRAKDAAPKESASASAPASPAAPAAPAQPNYMAALEVLRDVAVMQGDTARAEAIELAMRLAAKIG